MNKHHLGFFLLLFLLLIALAFVWKPDIVGVVANSLKIPNRVNVILIVVDALRADHLSIFGYDRNTSPRIERVAQEGTVFECAYTHVPLTLPTFTTMFTSLYPYSHRVLTPFKGPSPKAVTLAEILQKHGWQTGAVVGASNLDSDLGLSQGFQFYDDTFPKNADSIMFQHRNKVEYQRRAEEVNHLVFNWLDRVRKSNNFFILIHYIDPHFPYTPPPPFDRAYHDHDDQDQNSRWIDMYDGEVAYTDKNVGELFDYLKRTGLRENTLVILTSDHGEGLGDHDYQFHGGKLYEADVRVPLVFVGPGVIHGQRIRGIVQHVDLAPTILDYLNLPKPAFFQGISFLPLLEGKESRQKREYAILEKAISPRDMKYSWAVRNGNEKFIWSSDGNHEFYDLESDPKELNNLFESQKERAMSLFVRGFAFRSQLYPHPLAIKKKKNEDLELDEKLKALGYVN